MEKETAREFILGALSLFVFEKYIWENKVRNLSFCCEILLGRNRRRASSEKKHSDDIFLGKSKQSTF